MMNSSTPEELTPKSNGPDSNETITVSTDPIDLSNDPDFLKLIEHYQHAEFGKCSELLAVLENRYPDHPRLLRFKDDLQMKLSLKNMIVSSKKAHKNNQIKVTFKMGVFAIISTILVMVVFFFSYFYNNHNAQIQQAEMVTSQLTSLNNQAEQLLRAGQPQPAVEIIEKIKSINPDYANLPNLTLKTEDLLRLEAKYQAALDLVAEQKNSEALVILKEIEAEKPGMWDVS